MSAFKVIMDSPYVRGIALSAMAMIITVLGTVVVYRLLWSAEAAPTFVAWITLFEIAQFLLISDMGFSHEYIRRVAKDGTRAAATDDLESLRGQLAVAGLCAAGVLVACSAYISSSGGQVDVPALAIAALVVSTVITILGYAETAFLRVGKKFTETYSINIVAQTIFVFVAIMLPIEPVVGIAIAVLARAVILYLAQIALVGEGYSFRFSGRVVPSGGVLIYNFSYFSLFLLDGIVLLSLGGRAQEVALILLVKKYFDVIRGFVDAGLQVLSVKFATEINKNSVYYIMGVVVLFLFVAILAPIAMRIWVGVAVLPADLVGALALSGAAIAVFRIETTRQYFAQTSGLFILAGCAIFSKAIFFVVVNAGWGNVTVAYAIQGIILLGCVFVWCRQLSRDKGKGNGSR